MGAQIGDVGLGKFEPQHFFAKYTRINRIKQENLFRHKKIPQDYIWNEKIKYKRMQFGVHFDIGTFISGL